MSEQKDKGKGYLDFVLMPMHEALSFQILKQHPHVTEYLQKYNFVSKHGLVIKLGEEGLGFPEFKDSKNTLYLRPSNGAYAMKVDTTRFIRNSVRDNKKRLLLAALKEFVEEVKRYSKAKYPAVNVGAYHTYSFA